MLIFWLTCCCMSFVSLSYRPTFNQHFKMLQNSSQAHRDWIFLSFVEINIQSEFVTVRWIWPTISVYPRGHGKNDIYNNNNYTLSVKSFQQRNGSSQLVEHTFIWIIEYDERPAGDTVFTTIRSTLNTILQNKRKKKIKWSCSAIN